MMIRPTDTTTPGWAVYRYSAAKVWQPISPTFPTIEQAQRYLKRLPDCWGGQVREVPTEPEALP